MKSYLKFLSRNKLYTGIEFVGLAVSLAFVVLIGTSLWEQYRLTRNIPDADRVYLIYSGATPYDTKEQLAQIPEITACGGFRRQQRMIGGGAEKLIVQAGYIDPELVEIMPLPLKEGRFPAAPGEVLLSADRARSLFPGESAIGRSIEEFNPEDFSPAGTYTVTGILSDVTATLYPDIDLCFRFDAPSADEIKMGGWREGYWTSVPLFIKVSPGTAQATLEEKIRATEGPWLQDPDRVPLLLPYSNIYFYQGAIPSLRRGYKGAIWVMAALGLLLLLSAILNYVNLSFAAAGSRSKEMATRQLVGASRLSVVETGILESLLFTAAAYGASLVLAAWIAPYLNRNLSLLMNFPFGLRWTPAFLLFSVALVLFVGAVSGWLPARFVASFRPLDIASGAFRRKRKTGFSRVSIVFQSFLAVVMISMTLVLEAQIRHMNRRPIGVNTRNLYALQSPLHPDAYHDLVPVIETLRSSPLVKSIGFTDGFPTRVWSLTAGKGLDGEGIRMDIITCDSTAFRLFGFPVEEDFHTPLEGSLWLSEPLFRAVSPDGSAPELTAFHYSYTDMDRLHHGYDHVAGIIREFPIYPAGMAAASVGGNEFPMVAVVSPDKLPYTWLWPLIETTGDHRAFRKLVSDAMEEYYRSTVGISYRAVVAAAGDVGSGYIDDLVARQQEDLRKVTRIVELFCLVAIMISLLGLIAMSTYYARVETKRIAVQKVFGGTVSSETRRNMRKYLVLNAVSILIGIPVASGLSALLLQSIPYRISGYWWIFALAAGLSLAISFASVLWQTLKAARTNPAVELKKD